MNKGALAILVHGGTDNWSSQRWKGRFEGVCPDRAVRLLPDASLDPAEVHYAAVWKPQPGELAAFPNLRVIFNLGAGVDALMADRSLPNVPLVRVAVTDRVCRAACADASPAGALFAGVATCKALGAKVAMGGRRGLGWRYGAGYARG